MNRLISFLLAFVLLSACQAQKEEITQITGYNSETLQNEGAKEFFSWTEDRIPLVSAHRGGPYRGYPENAIETFEYVSKGSPTIIECDIAMSKDSVLYMMHDYTLDRTTNGTGSVSDYNWIELEGLKLKDNDGNLTDFKIPTLDQVLEWGRGKVLFTLDVKRGVPFEMVIEAIEKWEMESYAAVITYNADDAQKVFQLNAELMISVGIGNQEAYQAHREKGIPDENMIAFVGVREPEEGHYQFLHDKKISTILGVLGNLDRQAVVKGDSLYAGFVKRGADILATDRPLEASKAIKSLQPKNSIKYKFYNR